MNERLDREIRAWKDATSGTTSFRLWKSAVLLSASRKGAPAETEKIPRVREILHRAFEHGEPVWMAADEVAFVAKELTRKRAPTTLDEIRRAYRSAHAAGRVHTSPIRRDRDRRRARRTR